MASEENAANKDKKPFELPEMLRAAQKAAHDKLRPQPNERDQKELRHLVDFLTPFKMPDPKHKGEGKPKDVIREAVLIIAYDRREGAFKVTLSDKRAAVGGSWLARSLSTALVDTERALEGGKFPWAEKEE